MQRPGQQLKQGGTRAATPLRQALPRLRSHAAVLHGNTERPVMKTILKTFSTQPARVRLHRCTLAAGALLATGLLAALAATCQEQVQRGERFRAAQRMTPPVLVAAAAPRQAR
jgi:hypothetical protein